MYRISYEQGNGYRCGCCRRTWEQTLDVETEEEVLEFLEELAACQIESEWEDDDDRYVESIEKEIGVDIYDQFKPRQEKIDAIVAERRKKKEDKAKAEERAEKKARKALYNELKKEFES